MSLSIIGFALSLYTYQSTKIFIPIFGLLLIIFYRKFLIAKSNLKYLLLGAVIVSPLIITIITDKSLSRFQSVSLITDKGPVVILEEQKADYNNPNQLVSKIIHNKPIAYANFFLTQYLKHFDPAFLFIEGDPIKRDAIPGMGQLYLFEIITIAFGAYLLLTKKYPDKKLILLWLLISPIPASLTFQSPHAMRAYNMVMPLALISGLGLGMLLEKIARLNVERKILLYSLIGFFVLFSFINYLDGYYVHLPKRYAVEWESGFSKLVPLIINQKNQYQKVVVTLRYDQPYILFLFYSKYNPNEYRKTVRLGDIDEFGFGNVKGFDKYEFRPINQAEMAVSKNVLFAGTSEEMKDQKVLDIINFPNNQPAFKIVGI